MIVDLPNSFNITVGTPNRQAQDGDAQVIVPPVISPVVLSLHPHQVNVGAAIVLNSSAFFFAQQSRTNQAAIQTLFATLSAGLWELEIYMATQFNFLATIGTFVGVALLWGKDGVDHPLIKRIASISNSVDYNRVRVLSKTNTTLSIETGLTGVGQSADGQIGVNCIKIL